MTEINIDVMRSFTLIHPLSKKGNNNADIISQQIIKINVYFRNSLQKKTVLADIVNKLCTKIHLTLLITSFSKKGNNNTDIISR